MKKAEEIKKVVREGYARVAQQESGGCGCGCEGSTAQSISRMIGYSEEDLASTPEGANLGLGCGNPIALASLKPGEVVLDLGSGAGFDSFLAASRVGPQGKVIGVDMTPEMLEKAQANARQSGYKNVEFRLGEIENLPAADNSVDVIISNCVINLSLDKSRVFREAYRVLKPGGRLMVSDMVLLQELPSDITESAAAYVGCIAGAIKKDAYLKAIKAAGFKDVAVVGETQYPMESVAEVLTALDNAEMETMAKYLKYVASIKVKGLKPA